MKILLVRPETMPETIGLQHVMIVEPLEMEVIGALKRPQDEVILIDMILEKKPFTYFLSHFRPDVLCITGYITNVNTIIGYCKKAKTIIPLIKTIVGGVHCEVCPEDFMNESVDFRVVRNATTVFTQLLNCIDGLEELPKGILQTNDDCDTTELPAFDFSFPIPDRSLTKKYRNGYFYIFHNKVALIKTSFGCPYTCSFCFCRVITNGIYKQRSIQDVLDELEGIHENEIYVVDDDFLVHGPWLQSFIKEVKERKIKKHYLVYGRADFIANHPDLMLELKSIGLRTVIVGFESFSEKELSQYQKNTDTATNKKAMEVLNDLHIECFATIILSPDWDKQDFKNLQRNLKELKIYYINLQPLTPLPKTGIFYPANELLIQKQEFEKWDLAHISIQPSKLTVHEYYTQILETYNKIVFQPKALRKYITGYSLPMLWKMIRGSQKVSNQYKQKIKEAKKAYA